MTGEALAFWKRNAPLLAADGRLTDATVDGFTVLCMTWADYLAANKGDNPIQKICISKQFQQLLAAYGMTPASRKRLKLEKAAGIADIIAEKLTRAE